MGQVVPRGIDQEPRVGKPLTTCIHLLIVRRSSQPEFRGESTGARRGAHGDLPGPGAAESSAGSTSSKRSAGMGSAGAGPSEIGFRRSERRVADPPRIVSATRASPVTAINPPIIAATRTLRFFSRSSAAFESDGPLESAGAATGSPAAGAMEGTASAADDWAVAGAEKTETTRRTAVAMRFLARHLRISRSSICGEGTLTTEPLADSGALPRRAAPAGPSPVPESAG